MTRASLSPLPLGYATALLPLVTIHLCFVISILEGYIEPCLPYWIDCTSISKSGRYGSAYFVFKGGMIPSSVLLIMFWQLNRHWLTTFNRNPNHGFLYLGAMGSLALLVYTLTLGHAGEHFRLLRRFGVVLFMFCLFISELKVGKELQLVEGLAKQGKRLLSFSAVILTLATISLILDLWLGDDYDRVENTFEWWLVLLLNLHLAWIVALWRTSGFNLSARSSASH